MNRQLVAWISISLSAVFLVKTAQADTLIDQQRAWVARTAKVLRFGTPIRTMAEMTRFESLTKDQAIDLLMEDPAFAITVLDFNLYFLGAKNQYLIKPQFDEKVNLANHTYGLVVEGTPKQALTSAVAVANGGNYFDLFNTMHKTFWSKRMTVSRNQSDYAHLPDWNLDVTTLSDAELIGNLIFQARYLLNDFNVKLFNGPAPLNAQNFATYCRSIESQIEALFALSGVVNLDFIPIRNRWGRYAFVNQCTWNTDESVRAGPPQDLLAFVKSYQEFKKDVLNVFSALRDWPIFDQFTPPMQRIWVEGHTRLAGYKTDDEHFFGKTFFSNYENSSTNFNRKRAAKILDTYFCDSLVPLNVIAPENHARGSLHASDPGCQSCHFKLDPMAGFFRYVGFKGDDLTGKDQIVFDDGTSLNPALTTAYWDGWKASESSGRTWNVGYVRSARVDQTAVNSYAEDIAVADSPEELSRLVAILRGAPEVKKCLVRRMAEYFIGTNQLFDEGWIDEMAQGLSSTTEGFKSVIRRLVKSNTFVQRNPKADQCFDFAEGATAADRPPCEVASILQANCVGCHGGRFGARGLSLDSWIVKSDGSKGFPHFQENKEISFCTTVQRIHDRINSSDPNFSMPLMGTMPIKDREGLFLWADREVNKCS